MRSPLRVCLALLLISLACNAVLAQSLPANDRASAVPHLIKFSGAAPGTSGTVGITFALYKEQSGGAPLWLETQSVTVDANGRYTILLGANHAHGLPLELFAGGEARWLGVQANGQAEMPRTLLVSVPYALAAGDAQTFGGKPLSAFVFAGQRSGPGDDGLNYVNTAAVGFAANAISGAATGYLPMFTSTAGDMTSSTLFQTTGGAIGVNTTSPASMFHIVSPLPGVATFQRQGGARFTFQNDTDAGNTGTIFYVTDSAAAHYKPLSFDAYTLRFRADGSDTNVLFMDNNGRLGVGTTTPGAKLEVAGDIKMSAGGGIIFPDGKLTSAAGGGGATYTAGSGLSLSANSFSVNFGGNGSATQAARSDHNHDGNYVSLSGSYTNPSWLSAVAASKITGQIADAQIASLSANKLTGRISSTGATFVYDGSNGATNNAVEVLANSNNYCQGVRATLNYADAGYWCAAVSAQTGDGRPGVYAESKGGSAIYARGVNGGPADPLIKLETNSSTAPLMTATSGDRQSFMLGNDGSVQLFPLGTATSQASQPSAGVYLSSSAYDTSVGSVAQVFALRTEAAANNVAGPGAKLNFLFGQGHTAFTLASTGLSINQDGTISFAGGQTFPGTSYVAGSGLNLSGNSFSVNFGGNGSAPQAARSDHHHDGNYVSLLGGYVNPAWLTSLDAAKITGTLGDTKLSNNVPLLSKANTFTANQTIAANLTAVGSVGVGVTEPSAKLDVAGDIKLTGAIQFPDGSSIMSGNNTVPAGFMIASTSATPPPGYRFAGSVPSSATPMWMPWGPAFNRGRIYHASVELGGKIYLIGGQYRDASNNVQVLDDVQIFDTATSTWTTGAPMPTPLCRFGAAAVGGKIYVVGGRTSYTDSPINEVRVYDPLANTWTTTTPMSAGHELVAVVAIGSALYTFAPTTPGISGGVEIFDTTTDTWSALTPSATLDNAVYVSAVAWNNDIYVLFARSFTNSPVQVWRFTVGAGWIGAINSIPNAPALPAALSCNGKFYVIGGISGSNQLATVNSYDGLVWNSELPLATATSYTTAACSGANMYVIGGRTPTEQYSGAVQKFGTQPPYYLFVKN